MSAPRPIAAAGTPLQPTPRDEATPGGRAFLDRTRTLRRRPVPDDVSKDAFEASGDGRASHLLYRRQAVAVELLTARHRVMECGRRPIPGHEAKLVRGADGKHGFSGLIRCGSVWTCAVCRFQIARQRGEEVAEALRLAHAQGLQISLVTFTAGHDASDALASLWKRVRAAATDTFGSRAGRAYLDSIGYVGRITANEVTHGTNGWHPHLHVVVFSREPVRERDLWPLWEHEAQRHGLTVNRGPFDVRSVSRDAESIGHVAAYMSKRTPARWTLSNEVTAGATKAARGTNLTPFQLLDAVEADGVADAADLFREYVAASRGVSSLRWSRGLRDALGVTAEELSDEEAANVQDQETRDVYTFTPAEWSAVFLVGMRVRLLRAADRDGLTGVRRVVAEACARAYGRRRRPPPGVALRA